MPDFTLIQFASKDDMYKAMQAEIDPLQAQLISQSCAVQQGDVPVEALASAPAAPPGGKGQFGRCPHH